MRFSIENGFFIPGPSLAAEKQGSGLKFSIENENCKPRMKFSSENENFVRGGMVFSCVRARMNFFDLGHDMGGCKTYGGGKRTRERALLKNSGPFQKSFWSAQSWIFVQEKQSNDTRGGWKTYCTRGVQNLFLGRVSFMRFSSPLFFPPPHGVL